MSPDGFLVLDKPEAMTSHDVVVWVRRLLGTRKVGHAGTLDPMATGVLVVGVGIATRLLRFVEATTKTYEAAITFGSRTDSYDATGQVVERMPAAHVDKESLEAALKGYLGESDQVPPMVSAIKVGGERLHAKARRGEEVERPPRRIRIDELVCTEFEPGEEPVARIRVVCSPGTYVRSLADDVGVALGTRAHLSALRRTAVGTATVTDAIRLDDLTPAALRGILDIVGDLPVRELSPAEEDDVRNGRVIPASGRPGEMLAARDGQIVAVLTDDGEGTRIVVGVPTGTSLPLRMGTSPDA